MRAFIEEKRFGSKLLFSNSCFDVPALSRTAILGPSGCGKTTLMRILSGLDHDFAGRIDDGPVNPIVLFQEDRLSERISVLSNLLAVTDDKEKAREILSALDLGSEEKSHIHELSGGMRRRVAIARVLLLDCDYLFLDEPFRGLDDEIRRKAASLILQYSENRTIVFITHDEDELPLLCADNVIKLSLNTAETD